MQTVLMVIGGVIGALAGWLAAPVLFVIAWAMMFPAGHAAKRGKPGLTILAGSLGCVAIGALIGAATVALLKLIS
jgi:hypothetical protein